MNDAKRRMALILERLKKERPDATCELQHRNPYELLMSVILSAQCTDDRVNQVTPKLFQKYPTPEAMAKAPLSDLEKVIRSTGFYRNKAKSIKGASERIVKEYKGKVPQTMEELLTLPGVARKTANVVLGVAYGVASGIVVDTHVTRVSRRLGFTKHTNPQKIEKDLLGIMSKQDWIFGSHLLVLHGRYVCKARKPDCPNCVIHDLCPSRKLFLKS